MEHNNIIFGVEGLALNKAEENFFKKSLPLGFILFSRNIESALQLKMLTDSLRELYPEKPPLIFIDQEGGRVARLKPPIIKSLYPPAEYFANMYQIDKIKAKNGVKENYSQMMIELKNLGIDSPCAPVCDIRHGDADPIIGDRSFGSDPIQIVDLCKEAIDAINKNNGTAFIKHIPGHGRAKVDSHLTLPIIDTKLKILEKTDFKVFKDLAQEDVWAMTAHIVFKALDPKNPATLSSKVINYIKDEIGFKGPLVTDDICMNALHGKLGEKIFLLKLILSNLSQGKEWREIYNENFKKLFEIDICNNTKQEIIAICEKEKSKLHPSFCRRLAMVAKKSIDAGCNIVLHCSSDLKEMKAIYKAIKKQNN